MKKIKTIYAQSGHTIAIFAVEDSEMHPAPHDSGYTHFYEAKNFDADGVSFFYLAKGYSKHPGGENQIHVWYKNKKMWSSFGTNFQTAIDGAQRDGWLHAD